LFDGFVTQGLGEMRFADPRRAEEQDVLALTQVIARGQLKDLFADYAGRCDSWL
jgi:hypothetical protein